MTRNSPPSISGISSNLLGVSTGPSASTSTSSHFVNANLQSGAAGISGLPALSGLSGLSGSGSGGGSVESRSSGSWGREREREGLGNSGGSGGGYRSSLRSRDIYSDSRYHSPHANQDRRVSLAGVGSSTPGGGGGGGSLYASEDGSRCVVAGREVLRIIKVTQPSDSEPAPNPSGGSGGGSGSWLGTKHALGPGGARMDAGANYWKGSGLKIDSAFTDVVWAQNDKIFTCGRNGEFHIWDVSRGSCKLEKRIKEHQRSVNDMAYSRIAPNYLVTASQDGTARVWDARDPRASIVKFICPAAVRSVTITPTASWQVICGLDNGSILRCDPRQTKVLDRVLVAHRNSIMTCAWSDGGRGESANYVATGSLDKTVKIWDLTHGLTQQPAYTLHPSYPVRHVEWRPGSGYECELGVISHSESGGEVERECLEIWDVRRGWIAKWGVGGSEGGSTDFTFLDSHTAWSHTLSGTFSQLDLSICSKPIDLVGRNSMTWDGMGTLGFVIDAVDKWEIPYDDIREDRRSQMIEKKIKPKTLGDASYQPHTQTFGTYPVPIYDREGFTRLAKGYIMEGDRREMCSTNAQVALDAGYNRAAHTWFMLQCLFTDFHPDQNGEGDGEMIEGTQDGEDEDGWTKVSKPSPDQYDPLSHSSPGLGRDSADGEIESTPLPFITSIPPLPADRHADLTDPNLGANANVKAKKSSLRSPSPILRRTNPSLSRSSPSRSGNGTTSSGTLIGGVRSVHSSVHSHSHTPRSSISSSSMAQTRRSTPTHSASPSPRIAPGGLPTIPSSSSTATSITSVNPPPSTPHQSHSRSSARARSKRSGSGSTTHTSNTPNHTNTGTPISLSGSASGISPRPGLPGRRPSIMTTSSSRPSIRSMSISHAGGSLGPDSPKSFVSQELEALDDSDSEPDDEGEGEGGVGYEEGDHEADEHDLLGGRSGSGSDVEFGGVFHEDEVDEGSPLIEVFPGSVGRGEGGSKEPSPARSDEAGRKKSGLRVSVSSSGFLSSSLAGTSGNAGGHAHGHGHGSRERKSVDLSPLKQEVKADEEDVDGDSDAVKFGEVEDGAGGDEEGDQERGTLPPGAADLSSDEDDAESTSPTSEHSDRSSPSPNSASESESGSDSGSNSESRSRSGSASPRTRDRRPSHASHHSHHSRRSHGLSTRARTRPRKSNEADDSRSTRDREQSGNVAEQTHSMPLIASLKAPQPHHHLEKQNSSASLRTVIASSPPLPNSLLPRLPTTSASASSSTNEHIPGTASPLRLVTTSTALSTTALSPQFVPIPPPSPASVVPSPAGSEGGLGLMFSAAASRAHSPIPSHDRDRERPNLSISASASAHRMNGEYNRGDRYAESYNGEGGGYDGGGGEGYDGEEEGEKEDDWQGRTHARKKLEISEDEESYRRIGWYGLKQQFDFFVDQGDMQMCALMVHVAGKELEVEEWRVQSFLDAYIDALARLRLNACAAYVRKHTKVTPIASRTGLETVIPTTCNTCHHPLLSSSPSPHIPPFPTSHYSICQSCKTLTSRCSICHLPVKGLRYHCTVCSHGGHTECYRGYYASRGFVEVGVEFEESPGGMRAGYRPGTGWIGGGLHPNLGGGAGGVGGGGGTYAGALSFGIPGASLSARGGGGGGAGEREARAAAALLPRGRRSRRNSFNDHPDSSSPTTSTSDTTTGITDKKRAVSKDSSTRTISTSTSNVHFPLVPGETYISEWESFISSTDTAYVSDLPLSSNGGSTAGTGGTTSSSASSTTNTATGHGTGNGLSSLVPGSGSGSTSNGGGGWTWPGGAGYWKRSGIAGSGSGAGKGGIGGAGGNGGGGGGKDKMRVYGQPCPIGCGHLCFATNEGMMDEAFRQ
ncbi:hypothetical protein SISNIDRAFT_491919 [Sistotremastrum niveocremeum HHB9708]|uniref:Uncharacterized protein n=1 Tax=Sistotremastrum niveocremeum HHB9708 TaxID=1314777 RepID=A0A164M8X1_9AGAM|nr:hypothetical protein SISNIDRAFT_491919 [Sistotremastrum niveocremeum HHB9708]